MNYSEFNEEEKNYYTRVVKSAVRTQMQSTYRTDYFGMPQGIEHESTMFQPEWKANMKYSLNTESRSNYQIPKQSNIIKNNTTRYGCNSNHKAPAVGVAPNCSSFWMNKNIKQK